MFSSLILSEKSKAELLERVASSIPDGWDLHAHHMTIRFGDPALPAHLAADEGVEREVFATHLGVSDMAIAVLVFGYPTENKIPHVTVAINAAAGGKPVMANDIENWTKLNEPLVLSGTVSAWKIPADK